MKFFTASVIRYRAQRLPPGIVFEAEPQHVRTPLAKGRVFACSQEGLRAAVHAGVSTALQARFLKALAAAEQEPPKQEPPKQEPPKQEPPKQEPPKQAGGETPKVNEETPKEATGGRGQSRSRSSTKEK